MRVLLLLLLPVVALAQVRFAEVSGAGLHSVSDDLLLLLVSYRPLARVFMRIFVGRAASCAQCYN